MMEKMQVGVIGLGYVGLPVAVAMASKHNVVGFDLDQLRIKELQAGFDRTMEVDKAELVESDILFTNEITNLYDCNFFIIAVPTPIDNHKVPNIESLLGASRSVAACLKSGDIVVYESTVFPGATEEYCIPILEKESGLKFNTDFFVGYSPERINPGDKINTFTTITKVVSGSTKDALTKISKLYGSVIDADIYPAKSIKVAEAAKVIENTQRDLNIAFINELSVLFHKLDISIWDVLDAAKTKWNFLGFEPGLVGGHCIGVDPYYLTYQAQKLGHDPDFILAGRRINEGMSVFIVQQIIKEMIKINSNFTQAEILILGCTFKENCPDLRNSKVIDVIRELTEFSFNIDVMDPIANFDSFETELPINTYSKIPDKKYDVILVMVPHDQFLEIKSLEFKKLRKEKSIVFDLKNKITHVADKKTL